MSSPEQIARLELAGRQVLVDWADGHRSLFHAIWLRDNCGCPACRHPSGQRLLDTASLPAGIAPAGVNLAGATVEITWANDGHRSRYAASWLRAHCYEDAERARRRPRPRLWGAELQAALPEAAHAAIASDERALRDWLAAVDTFGFALLRGVPVVPGEVTRVVERFGFVRETNYGRLFDVKSVVNPSNLAYTGLALTGHTDNPYRDPTPSLQLLHCLSSSTSGGENTLVDGFRVAEALRAEDPAGYELLTRHPVRFRYQDEDTDLTAEFPILLLNPRGELAAVHYNNRSPAPFDLPAEQVEPFYAAYREFVTLLESPAYQVRFKLEPGDLFIVDNLRVLHGRTGFSAAGQRHLQGCYADRDSLRSRLAVLNRSLVRCGPMTKHDVIDAIFTEFRDHGQNVYLGEPVTLTEHMLQTAFAAEQDGAGPLLIAAAVLHDFGHLVHELPEDSAEHGVDTRHEEAGAAYLSRYFVPAVVEPTRLHVAAKRYLCAVDPAYLAALSPASILSLQLQGGPLDAAGVAAYQALPYAQDAARLRRYDDQGKVPGMVTPDLEHYRPYLEAGLRAGL